MDAEKGNKHFFCVCVCRRNVLLELHGYDERIKYGEDLDVAYRVILNYPVAFNSAVFGYYRQDAENRAMKKNEIKFEECLECYIDKYNVYRISNQDFCRLFDTAVAIVSAKYLFRGNKTIYETTAKLNFSCIPFYYRLFFKTPYWFGKTIYIGMCTLKKIWYLLHNHLFFRRRK